MGRGFLLLFLVRLIIDQPFPIEPRGARVGKAIGHFVEVYRELSQAARVCPDGGADVLETPQGRHPGTSASPGHLGRAEFLHAIQTENR